MAGDIFTLDADNNAAVRTVSVNAGVSETNSPVIFTTDNNAAVRTVSVKAGVSETNSPVIFTTDENGNAAVRVVGAGGGSTPVIDELNITPSTSAQTITAPSGTDGYSPVNVAAVTSAIDANIVAGNIKKDVAILGVTGSYEGKTPTGTKSITANGTYDVKDFATADVQVPTTAPAHYIEKTVDANGKLISGTNIINLNGVTDVGNYALCGQYYQASFPANTSVDLSSLTTISGNNACQYMFKNCVNMTSVDISSLTAISGDYACQYMFQGCSALTSMNLSSLTTISGSYACNDMFIDCFHIINVDLSSLTTISGSNFVCSGMFQSCSRITSVDLSGLTTINGNYACNDMFFNCEGLISIDLSSLTTIGGTNACGGMFSGCRKMISIDLPSLTTISALLAPSYSTVFNNCTYLESVKFGGLKSTTFASAVNQLQYLFNSLTGSKAPNGCTVHFPSNFDPSNPSHTFDASTLAGYPTFGGNASYIKIAFDLPATES